MALETGTYVNDLVVTNPTSTDPKSQGDDHLRLIKNVLKNTFAGFPGLVVTTGTEAQGATVNDYVVTVSPAPAAYTSGFFVAFKAAHANTGSATLKVNALTAASLLDVDGSALIASDIKLNAIIVAWYDGTNFYVISGNDRSNRSGDTYAGTHNFTSAVTTVATQTANDNSTKAASTAYVDAGIAAEAAIRSSSDTTLQNNINAKAGLDSPAFTGIPTAPTAPTGTNTTQIATTAYVVAAAFNSALPAQAGNAGKLVTTDGTNASWTAIKTVGGSSLFGVGNITTGISTVNATITTDTTLTGSYLYVPVQMSSMGKSVTLPAANTLTVGADLYRIDNSKGGYPCGIRDNAGTLIMAVAAGGEALVSLKYNTTAAGVWSVTGTNLEPGLITIDNTFSSTYLSSTVFPQYVALDNDTSIHFAALSSGFAAFVVDNLGKMISTPVTVSATASSVPKIAFKVTATTAIVFYGSSATDNNAVVLSLTGATPSLSLSVGTPASYTTTLGSIWGGEDFVSAPKIAQLSSTLYILGYASTTALTAAMAISVSGTTVTIGTPASIIASSAVVGSTTTYPLTSTTALVLYKTGGAAPYTNNAVVVSVSGTTCTVGTPVALNQSTLTSVPSSVLISATKFIIADDNNTATTANAIAGTISGTTITAGTSVSVETSVATSSNVQYTSSNATRYNPHLWVTSTGATNNVGLWYMDGNGVSRVVILTENAGTITAGTILYYSISSTTGTDGLGVSLAQSSSEFVAIRQDGTVSATNSQKRLIPHKIVGNVITSGSAIGVNPNDISVSGSPANIAVGNRLSNGDYIIGVVYIAAAQYANTAIPVYRSNGDDVVYRGSVKCPMLNGASNYLPPCIIGDRAVLIGRGSTNGTAVAAYLLRTINVEFAA